MHVLYTSTCYVFNRDATPEPIGWAPSLDEAKALLEKWANDHATRLAAMEDGELCYISSAGCHTLAINGVWLETVLNGCEIEELGRPLGYQVHIPTTRDPSEPWCNVFLHRGSYEEHEHTWQAMAVLPDGSAWVPAISFESEEDLLKGLAYNARVMPTEWRVKA